MKTTDYIRDIQKIVDQRKTKQGASGFEVATVPAAYVSGNPTLQRANETSTTLGSKTHRVIQPWSNRNGVPVASQKVGVLYDEHDNRVLSGPLVDLANVKVDADYIMGLRPVTPGNTVIVSANTERNVVGSTYTQVKKFALTRPGKYRVTFELSRDTGAVSAKLMIRLNDGTEIDASASEGESTVTYPTFSAAKTLDMTQPLQWGGTLIVKLRSDTGDTAYIQNVSVKYADATASLALYDVATVD